MNPPYLQLPFRFDAAALQADLDRVQDADWIAHYSSRDYQGDWSVAPLRSVAGAPDSPWSSTLPEIFKPTPLLTRCPYVNEVIDSFRCDKTAVRFMKLAAGSVIREHADSALSLDFGEARLHIPVVTDPRVEFVLGGERLALGEGECWYMDFTLPHSIVNAGDRPRVHLVMDCRVNNWLLERMPWPGGTPA